MWYGAWCSQRKNGSAVEQSTNLSWIRDSFLIIWSARGPQVPLRRGSTSFAAVGAGQTRLIVIHRRSVTFGTNRGSIASFHLQQPRTDLGHQYLQSYGAKLTSCRTKYTRGCTQLLCLALTLFEATPSYPPTKGRPEGNRNRVSESHIGLPDNGVDGPCGGIQPTARRVKLA